MSQNIFKRTKNNILPQKRKDGLDIAAVRDKAGTPGHALMNQEHNTSKDKNPHRGLDFLPDSLLKKDII